MYGSTTSQCPVSTPQLSFEGKLSPFNVKGSHLLFDSFRNQGLI